MDLKLTTKRALEYEERTGKDILIFIQEIAKTEKITIKEVIDLFLAMGENYTIEDFDKWDISLTEKITEIMNAVKEYTQGKK